MEENCLPIFGTFGLTIRLVYLLLVWIVKFASILTMDGNFNSIHVPFFYKYYKVGDGLFILGCNRIVILSWSWWTFSLNVNSWIIGSQFSFFSNLLLEFWVQNFLCYIPMLRGWLVRALCSVSNINNIISSMYLVNSWLN